MYLLYLSMALGWLTIRLLHTLAVLVFLKVGTLSLALSRVVSTYTTLLSIYCKQRQGPTLCQRILPLSFFFAHCLPFFMLSGKCLRFSDIVPVASTPKSQHLSVIFIIATNTTSIANTRNEIRKLIFVAERKIRLRVIPHTLINTTVLSLSLSLCIYYLV